MGIIHNGMSIQCRTEEEYATFIDFARREGYKWAGSQNIEPFFSFNRAISFQVGLRRKGEVTLGLADSKYGDLVDVEASQLFHNFLQARRVKHGID